MSTNLPHTPETCGIRKVCIAGAGTMGSQIAEVMASHGIETLLYDSAAPVLERARSELSHLPMLRVCPDLATAVRGADLIIESIPEDLRIKRRFLREVGRLASPQAIIASNTSDILPSKIAPVIANPGRFCAYHFHAPRLGAKVVDIMPHKTTDIRTLTTLESFSRTVGLIPIVLGKEHAAYIYNALLNAIMDTSVKLVMTGVSTFQDVDRAWMGNTGMALGPFGMLDLIGLDTARDVTRIRARKKPFMFFGVQFFNRMIKAGKLGMKSGQGFYTYPDPAYGKPDFLK